MISWKDAEKVYIIELLRQTKGHLEDASKISGLGQSTLSRKISCDDDLKKVARESRLGRRKKKSLFERGH